MKKKNTRGYDVFREALQQSFSDYHRQFSDSEREIHLNEDYERYINRLIQRSKNPIRMYFNTKKKCAAGIAAAILVVCSCSMTMPEVRNSLVEFVTNMTETQTEVFFDEKDVANAPKSIQTVYTLGTVPDGYTKTRFKDHYILVETTWTNENGDRIFLSQGTLDGTLVLDTENSDYTILEQNGKKLAFSQKHGIQGFYWYSDGYVFHLIMPIAISHEEAFSFINSLVILTNTN